MPVPTDITAGTISISGSTVTGVGTSFVASDIRQGDLFIWIEGGEGQWSPIVQTVTSNTVLTLAEPWTGPTISGARYRLRYQWDSSRVSAQSRQLIEMLDNGNVLALAGLTGPGVPVFDGPHSMEIRPVQDFINGVAYNVQVDTLADRAAYDGQAAGFSVLVSDVGDGRSAVYSKASNTSGDWTDPAYVTGPVGPLPGVEATVVTGAPGSTATVNEVPITGGVRLDFTLPAAEGFYNAGVYDNGTAYTTDQVVRHNGSSFIALQAVPVGTSPSSAFPPVDTAFWQVLAAKGADGLGTGDVTGPSGAVTDRIAVFDGTTGKLIKDSGVTVAGLIPADNSITNAKLADVPTATIKGRVAAGSGDPTDLTVQQVRTLLSQGFEIVPGGAITLSSSVANVEWSGLSVYKRLLMYAVLKPTSDNAIWLEYVGAGSIDTGGSYSQNSIVATDASIVAATQYGVFGSLIGGSTGMAYECTLTLEIGNFSDALPTRFISRAGSLNSAAAYVNGQWVSRHNIAASMDRLRIAPSPGNIAVGSTLLLLGSRS